MASVAAAVDAKASGALMQQSGVGTPALRRMLAAAVAALRQQGGGTSALLCAIVAAALLLGRRRQERRRRDGLPPLALKHHPLASWAIENSIVAIISILPEALRLGTLPPQSAGRVVRFLHLLAAAVLRNALVWWLGDVNRDMIYGDVPPFSGAPRAEYSLKDWVTTYLPFSIYYSARAASSDPAQAPRLSLAGFSLPRFVAKLFLMRLSLDMFFYAVHIAIHQPQLYWIHRRHHEDRYPGLSTNYHFSYLDRWLEADAQTQFAISVVTRVLGYPLTHLEGVLAGNYLGWHLRSSHNGKPLPTAAWFPPLAPLYNLAFGDNVDAANVRHHDLHHAHIKCNYSISVWPDVVMGTRRINDKDPVVY